MNEEARDLASLEFVWGTLTIPVDGAAGSVVLQRWLRARRVVAGVRAVEEAELVFLLAVDGDRVQVLDDAARLTAGPTLDELRAELEAAGLAADVTLTREDWDDSLEDELDLDVELEIELDGEDDVEWPEEPDWATWRFSAQGQAWAHLVAAFSPGPVTSAVWGGWSAIGGIDPMLEVDSVDRRDLPAVLLGLPTEGTGRGWLEVRSASLGRGDSPYFLQSPPATGVTFAPEEVDASAAELLRVLADPEADESSDLSRLVADPSLTVDADALRAALAPTDDPTPHSVVAAAVAIGVPAQLARLALGESSGIAEATVLEGRSARSLLGLLDGGLAGLAPRNRDLTALERAGVWLRERPVAGLALAAAEALAGVLLARRGGGRVARLGGALLIADGVADAALAGGRLFRARNARSADGAAR